MRAPILACLIMFQATPAMADWTYDNTLGPAGRAAVMGDGGTGIAVDCGNGGFPAFTIVGHDPGADDEFFVLRVDDRPEILLGADCRGPECLLEMDTLEQAEGFLDALRGGTNLEISLYRRGGLDNVTLAGSGTAIGQLTAAGCGF